METNNNEIEEMRQQMSILNKKLEDQPIINEDLMRKTLHGKMSWVRKCVKWEIILTPVCIWSFCHIKQELNLPYGPILFFIILLIINSVYDYLFCKVSSKILLHDNMKEAAKKWQRLKKIYRISDIIAYLLCIVWALWMAYDLYAMPATWTARSENIIFIGMTFAVSVISLLFAIPISQKHYKTNDEIMQQLNELNKE